MSAMTSIFQRVMPGLDPGIHGIAMSLLRNIVSDVCFMTAWMAGTSPAMTAPMAEVY